MDERARRVGRNEALFREVNERLEGLHDAVDDGSATDPYLCECGDPDCSEQIELTREEYERVRSDPALFAIVPGHEHSDVEQIVETNDRFDIVRKQADDAEEMAAELDPRSN